MSWKSYSHSIRFFELNFSEGKPFTYNSPLDVLQCLSCNGTGYALSYYGPGNIITYPMPKCSECLGKKVPPLPLCELGL